MVFWKPFNLAIFSVALPTQKHFKFLLSLLKFKNFTAFALVKIIPEYPLSFISSDFTSSIFNKGIWETWWPRDLNFKMDSSIQVGEVVKTMKSVNQSILQNVIPVDIYQSKKDTSSKDVLFSLNFQSPKKTLEDNDVNLIIDEIIRIAETKF